jgi:hypothetical protein
MEMESVVLDGSVRWFWSSSSGVLELCVLCCVDMFYKHFPSTTESRLLIGFELRIRNFERRGSL